MLQVEIQISDSVRELCTIFEGQTADEIADCVAAKHHLDSTARAAMVSELEKHLMSLECF